MRKPINKEKISITLDKTILESIENISSPQFRNRSHLIEYCVTKFLEEENVTNI